MSEEYMFENPYELLDKGFDKYDFAQIIILLQADRREWIEQYTKSHNDYVELEQENQQLKQKYEMQKDSNKLLCKAITCDDCDCKVCEAHKENIKYKSVLNEVREENQQLKDKLKLVESLACFNMPNNTPMVCMFKADYERNKYAYETIDKYKSVLDEIRECTRKYCSGIFTDDGEIVFVTPTANIVKILDKVKE